MCDAYADGYAHFQNSLADAVAELTKENENNYFSPVVFSKVTD